VSADKSGISYLQGRNHILVVDDDPGILKAVQRLLRQHNYEPILFSSAEAFKNHTDFESAVCVILDINLNDGSGIELRYGLKAAGSSVPVIYITGNDNPAVRKAALDSGCIAFLTKPFSVQELIEPLKRALPGFRGTTNLSATPGRPACPSRASGWSSLTTPWGFPCFVRFPCVHAVAPNSGDKL